MYIYIITQRLIRVDWDGVNLIQVENNHSLPYNDRVIKETPDLFEWF
jgi:hypothetical protein